MILIQHSLSSESVLISDQVATAAEAIGQLARALATRLGVEPGMIERAVLEREASRTTAFANGAAIPHCRLPGLDRFAAALMILRRSVRWDNDGHTVDTVLMLAGPSGEVGSHLRILANGSQLLDSRGLRAVLKRSPDAESAWRLIEAAEQAIEERRSREGVLRELHRDQGSAEQVDHLAEVASRFNW